MRAEAISSSGGPAEREGAAIDGRELVGPY